jgi:hypothetical protein
MVSMITNALFAIERHLANGGLYQHIFKEEIVLAIHQMEYHHLIHLSNYLDGQYLIFQNVHATNMVSTNGYTICIRRNVQVIL